MKKLNLILIFSFILLTISKLNSQNEIFTAEKMWQLKRVGAPIISNDGKKLLFTLNEHNPSDNSSKTNIYISNIDGSEQRKW